MRGCRARAVLCAGWLVLTTMPFADAAVAEQPTQRQAESNPYFDFLTSRRLESEGDLDGALAALERALAADPKSAELRAEMAALHLRQNRIDEARRRAQEALAHDPATVEAHRVLGLIDSAYAQSAVESGQREKASEYVKSAIAHLERVVATPGGATDVTTQYNLGLLYLESGSAAKAVEPLQRVVDQQPHSLQARVSLAQALGAAGRDAEAIDVLEPMAEQEPRLLATLAQLYMRLGRLDEAANAYQRGVAANPSNRELRLGLVGALLSSSADDASKRAIDALAPLIEKNPKDARALYLRAQAHRRAGDLAAAEQDAKAVIAAEPDGLSGPYALAQIYGQSRRHGEVIDLLEPIAAEATGQESVPLLTYLSFAYQSVGRFDDAVDTLRRARTLGPPDASLDAYLAQAHLDAGRYAEAAVLAAEAQKVHEGDLRFTRLHARALFENGAPSRALAVMEGALRSNPNDLALYLAMADLYTDAGRVEDGVRTLDRAAGRFPKDATVPFQLGAILEKAGRYGDAEKAFRRVLAMEPTHADALNYLGYMFADRGQRLDEAIELIVRALKIDEGNPSYLDSLGWAHFKRGDLAEAEKHLSRAAEALPANSVVQDHFGDLLARRGRYAEAVKAWSRALSGDGRDIDRNVIEQKIRDVKGKAQQDPRPDRR